MLHGGLLACAVGGTVFYMNGSISGVLLRADGMVSRERVAVAPAFEGRVAQVFVRPGDHVEKGQKIAVVKSVAISRTLADLAAEKARLMSKIAELEARRQIITDTLSLAKSSADETASFLNRSQQGTRRRTRHQQICARNDVGFSCRYRARRQLAGGAAVVIRRIGR